MSKSKSKSKKQPVTFQIIDYFDQDQTNEQLMIEDAPAKTPIPQNTSYVSRKVISWWNWFKEVKYSQLLNYRLYLFGRTDKGKSIGLSYFKERGFTEETIKKFALGYSLDAWQAFTDEALKKAYKLEFLEKTGLTIIYESFKS